MDATAAVIAFFSLGANLLGAALLLLFNPRNREVHWYIAFLAAMCLWLLAQGMDALDAGYSDWDLLLPVAVTMLPALFLASAIVERMRTRWIHWMPVLIGLVLTPFLLPSFIGEGDAWVGTAYSLWHAIGWFGGSALLIRRPSEMPRKRRSEYLVTISLLIVVPVLVSLGMILGSHGFFLYVLPLLTVGVQIIVFVGIVRLRFYDIEVRGARTGELAVQAAAAERLALLGEVAASIAHEVRNPLTGMRSLAQTLAEEDEIDAERRKRYARVVLDEIGRLERMVTNLLGVARRTPPSHGAGPTELAPLFHDLALLVGSQAARRRVRIDVDGDDAIAAAPRESLAQVLLNLLLNALAHAREGGRVAMLASADDERVTILVRDDGPGIPAGERDALFRPFNSRSDGGLGLGLSLVRRIADEADWKLEVDDAPGGGAELRLVVPRADRAAPTTSDARRPTPDAVETPA